jgi:hypothetical protein
MPEKNKRLSASRIKTLQGCSWLYWAKYHLKLPDKTNTGALRGTICHLVLEMVLNKTRTKHYDEMVLAGTIKACPSVYRLVRKHAKALGDKHGFDLLDPEHMDLMDKMIVNAFNYDFFGKGHKSIKGEEEFLLENKDPEYRVLGYIDKSIEFKNNKYKIVDYKSSKSKFTDKELETNLQAMIYSLANKKKNNKAKSLVEFLFLKFARAASQTVEFSDDELLGLEYYLAEVYKLINNFTEQEAKNNFAAHQPHPKRGEGFKGPLMCGFAKHPGQLKKDGNPMWHCAYKFPFEYYVLTEEESGDILKSSLELADLPSAEKGQAVEKRHYAGCPSHKSVSTGKPDKDFDIFF